MTAEYEPKGFQPIKPSASEVSLASRAVADRDQLWQDVYDCLIGNTVDVNALRKVLEDHS